MRPGLRIGGGDQPTYISVTGTLPAGTTNVRFRSTNITFEKVYENTTASGTPVYVYAPVGWNVTAARASSASIRRSTRTRPTS